MEGDDAKRDLVVTWGQVFGRGVPHNKALGLELLDLDRDGGALIRLPYDQKLVGNPATGVVHGGAVSSLMDATCGAAIFIGMDPARPIATLDLRIDYMRPAVPPNDVLCRARCIKITRSVAFAQATAYHTDESDPIATAASTFMVFHPS